MTQYIKAPFNFVPLNDKVFFPDWANQISHDIPFEDGESGTIELEMTAMTPIFIRNGHTNEDAEEKNENYTSFSKDSDGNYFIPATSVKGMIRNVLEIISFGKMSRISNDRYSIRDLQNKQYLGFFQNSDIHCGFMTKKETTIEITDHGIPRRISHKDLDIKWGTDFAKRFKNSGLLKSDENRTAFYKINLTKDKTLKGNFIELPLNPNNSVDKRIKVKDDPNGSFRGIIVLTGQPSARNDKGDFDKFGKEILKGSGKNYEFVFSEEVVQKIFECDYHEESGIFRDFCFVHKDSSDWKLWRKLLEKGIPVPIFFSKKNNEIQHFGLSYLYKLPFSKKIKEYLPPDHNRTNYDLSDCMFGTTTNSQASKGRVQFLNMRLKSGNASQNIQKPYMGSPKPTYYPIYLVQKGKDGIPDGEFTTMLSNTARLKGWKRYPVHENSATFTIPDGDKEEHLNPFYPINSGSKFSGKVNFHNLKQVEIGSLLQSIVFQNSGFHSIGFAKAFGFGKLKIEISSIKGLSLPKEEYIKSFRALMESEIPNYSNTNELRELFSMSLPQDTVSPLEYMELKNFVDCKKQNIGRGLTGEFLDYYSNLVVQKLIPPTIQKEIIAEITLVDKPTVKAKLIEGKDLNSKNLRNYPANIKLKKGDRIIVKSENMKDLIFLKIIKSNLP
jgi:CRISPR-associated protein (TIGR03986 family)